MHAIIIFLKTILYAIWQISKLVLLYLIILALVLGMAYLVEKITGYPIISEEKDNGSKSSRTD